MKAPTIIFLLVSIGFDAAAQLSKSWDQLSKGKYEVGFQDTVLFNHDQEYTLGKYTGPKPYFVRMWFPLLAQTGKQIVYGEYVKATPYRGIDLVADSINKVQMAAFVKWGVRHNLDLWASEDLTDSKAALADKLLRQQLNVFRTSKYPVSRHPVILYHHGNGGIPFENSVLFELLASYGYVIISADYHWPNLRESSYTQKSDLPLADVDFIVQFSNTLPFTDQTDRTYIGHSWGGCIALRLNQKGNTNFKQYLIFDSTIEQEGLEEFKAVSPYLDSLFRNHPNDFTTRTVLITSRGRYYEGGDMNKPFVQSYPQFIPFQLIDSRAFTLVNLKPILNHGSYTSVGVMRSVFSKQFPQSDFKTMNEQFKTYQVLVNLTKDILDGHELKTDQILLSEKGTRP